MTSAWKLKNTESIEFGFWSNMSLYLQWLQCVYITSVDSPDNVMMPFVPSQTANRQVTSSKGFFMVLPISSNSSQFRNRYYSDLQSLCWHELIKVPDDVPMMHTHSQKSVQDLSPERCHGWQQDNTSSRRQEELLASRFNMLLCLFMSLTILKAGSYITSVDIYQFLFATSCAVSYSAASLKDSWTQPL